MRALFSQKAIPVVFFISGKEVTGEDMVCYCPEEEVSEWEQVDESADWENKAKCMINKFYDSCWDCINKVLPDFDKKLAERIRSLLKKISDEDKRILLSQLAIMAEEDCNSIERITNRLLEGIEYLEEDPDDLVNYVLELSGLLVQNLKLEELLSKSRHVEHWARKFSVPDVFSNSYKGTIQADQELPIAA